MCYEQQKHKDFQNCLFWCLQLINFEPCCQDVHSKTHCGSNATEYLNIILYVFFYPKQPLRNWPSVSFFFFLRPLVFDEPAFQLHAGIVVSYFASCWRVHLFLLFHTFLKLPCGSVFLLPLHFCQLCVRT